MLIPDTFKARIQITEGDHWLWTGSFVGGYPTYSKPGEVETRSARRFIWECTGQSPAGPKDHLKSHCDVPGFRRLCVNPAHLYLVRRNNR